MCFEKAFHVILMHFYLLYLMFWGVFSKTRLFFSKILSFQNFDWSNLFFDQSKLHLKFYVSFCLFWLIKTVFRSIEYRESGFKKKTNLDLFKLTFSKVSNLFSLSLSPIQTWLHLKFFSFFIILFARFLSPNTGKTLLPFFLLLFSHFMHLCILIWGFRTYTYLRFSMILAIFSEIDHWLLFLWCY